jgi:dTMP kinase
MGGRERGRLIVLEGPDGSGKSTQLGLLAARLGERGHEPLVVREPGGTAVGERIRTILLDPEVTGLDLRAELFLFMAARAELVSETVGPALEAGRTVLSDRFLASSAVYQGFAGGLGLERVLEVGTLAVGGVRPDLTVVIDIDVEMAAARIAASGRARDRVERRDRAFLARVREGYLRYADLVRARHAGVPDRSVKVVDGARPVAAVADEVLRAVLEALEP